MKLTSDVICVNSSFRQRSFRKRCVTFKNTVSGPMEIVENLRNQAVFTRELFGTVVNDVQGCVLEMSGSPV